MSIFLPRIAPPVSATVYVPLHWPALMTTVEPSFKTLGSAAIRPRRTPCPVAVLPEKQYAEAENAPRLAPIPAALTDAVVFTSLASSSLAAIFALTKVLVLTNVLETVLSIFGWRIIRYSESGSCPGLRVNKYCKQAQKRQYTRLL